MQRGPNAVATGRVLDLTRLLSRVGLSFTGVDRVERAYLDALLQDGTPVWGVMRTKLGYVLLDAGGLAKFQAALDSGNWGSADILARITWRTRPVRGQAEAALRRWSLARCRPSRLSRMLKAHLPQGVTYVNTGHSNFTDRVIFAVRQVPGSRIAVLVHDTIPLDFPQYQAAGSPERFRAFLRRVGRWADLVICNSTQTEQDVARHMRDWGMVPSMVVAPLGVQVPIVEKPFVRADDSLYFVTLGTIEPRKNHALLLDIWSDFADGPDAPELRIIGARGWNNKAVFDRLDAAPKNVSELSGLKDQEVAVQLQNAAGLLFPSFAEGFGLPPFEAAALAVPVLVNDLPVYREYLGNIPVYADVSDRYLWATKIKELAETHRARQAGSIPPLPRWAPPTWDDHFNTVLSMM